METMNRRITLKDVADRAGVSYATAANARCVNSKCSKLVIDKVAKAAQELNYVPYRTRPTNAVFASRTEETNMMLKLRSEGYSNIDIAQRCGVNLNTVLKRIGLQPEYITVANKKLAGKVKSAKRGIRYAYMQHQHTVVTYNKLTAQINEKLEEARKMAEQLSAMRENALTSAKAMNTTLLNVYVPPQIH